MIPAITEVNFPSYATLSQATVSLQEMGDRTISTQIKIDGAITPNFTNWELRFKGERFILPIREPQAAKDNSSRRSIIDLTFESWAVFQLKRYFFVSLSEIETGVAIPDQYNASIILSLENFVQLFNKVLKYYFGDDIRMDLFGAGQHIYSTEPVSVEINKTYIWDVLVKFYELFDVRWTIEYDSQTSAYVIKVGYTADAITDHDFEYGYQGGLLKFERQVQDTSISNIILGRGGEKNLPYRYFKLADPNNDAWTADPDAIPELANIYFDRLRDINFRWYVRGWMQNSHRDTSWDATHTFPTYTDNDCPSEFQFAFHKGQTDEKFNPVEYVKDDASITKYGERWGAVDDNDEVFPTIQGRIISGLGRVDEVVSVSPIVTDDIQAAAKAAVQVNELNGTKVVTHSFSANQTHSDELRTENFTIPSGQTGNISYSIMNPHNGKTGDDYDASVVALNTNLLNIKAVDVATGTEYAPSGLAAGTYYLKYTFAASNYTSQEQGPATYGFNSIALVLSSVDTNAWKPTFDIWVKNIWQTTQGANESDADYSTRVWQSILGDRAGNEAKIVFSDGFMSVSEDYEFVIASYPVPDRSKTITSGGVNYDSEWKITLYKNDAEFQATGLYIPNATTGGSPQAGDHFFFIGIDMPFQYVVWGEETLNGSLADPVINKAAALSQYSDINPSWLITLDKVRCNTHEGQEYGQYLADRLAAGATVQIKDRRFTNGQTLTLYVQSINYIWNEPTDGNPYLVPDIEVTLSDKVISSTGTVSRISSELEIVKTTYAKSADIEQTVRTVGSALFLKKTGESDRSASPTSFSSKVSSDDFRQGDFGGAGWGHYMDGEGAAVLELDKLVVRKELRVNELIANQISYVGGKKITSAAAIECTQVVEDANYYYCYFDQKQGTVANLFQVNDIALGQNFDETNAETRYFRMVVSQVGVDYIRLTKSSRDGSGAPMKGDIIVQYGNLTDASRRYVIVEDVIGGGYQRMISGLNSTHADGKEYYFAGRENVSGSGSGSGSGAGDGTRWFVGDTTKEYAEWKNGILNIKGRITVRKSDGTYQAMDQYIANNDMTYIKNATNQGTLIDGGLVLTSMMQLGYTANEVYTVMAGINGVPNTSLSDQTMSIAAWFGGDMVDIENQGSGSGSGSGLTPAKSLFRMDGSGYLASGRITWGKLGGGHIPGLTWNDAGTSITIGGGGNSSVIIDGSVKLVNSSGNDISDLIELVQELSGMFEGESYYEGSTLKHRIKVKSAYVGLYAEGFISAGGPSSGSGGGGGGGITPLGMWQLLTNDSTITTYGDSTKIALSHIPSLPWSQITSGLPTTLAGYGITDAYTKSQVDNLIGAIDQFHYEIYASTSAVTNPQSNVLYLIGPTGSGADKYEEYVYASNTWTKIGDTSIDLSGYVTTTALGSWAGSANITTLGTITTGTWNGSTIANSYLTGSGKVTIGSTEIALGGTALTLAGLTSVTASKFYLNSNTYFEIDSSGYVHLVVPSGKGFYTEGFVSAGGASSGSGGGGGGGITPLGMWQLLTNDSTITTYGDNTAIALAHLGAVQTWVGQQGYATQTWVGQQGYATQTWVGQQNYIDRTVLWKQLQNNDNVSTYNSYKIAAAHLVSTDASESIGLIIGSGLSYNSTTRTLTVDGGVDEAIMSLQSQIDSVATKDCFDELTSTALFSDVIAASSLYVSAIELAGSDLATSLSGLSGGITTLQGYFTNGVANSALRLSDTSAYNLWGVEYWSNGVPKSVTAQPSLYIGSTQVQISSVAQPLTGITTGAFSSNVTIGGTLGVTGALTASTSVTTPKYYIGNSGIYFEVDSNGVYFYTNGKGIYTDGFVSAGGLSPGGSSGGGINPTAMWQLLTNDPNLSSYGDNTLINVEHLPISVSGSGNYIASITRTGGSSSSVGSIVATYGTLGSMAFANTSDYSTSASIAADEAIISSCLVSLQSQIDSVAARDMFDELKATSFFADTLAASSAYIDLVTGALSGNATTASYLSSSSYSKGSATNPVYFTGGLPAACSYYLSATLNSGTASKIAYYSGANAVSAYTSTVGSASLPVYISGGEITACTGSSIFSALSTANYPNLTITIAGEVKTIPYLRATYDDVGDDIGESFGTVSKALQSLQSQVDAVATRNCFDEITTTNIFSDIVSASSAYISTTYGELSGNATTASYLYSSSYGVGSGVTPVYFSGGRPATCSYSFGNGSGNVPISNGTMNTNLYAYKSYLDSDGYDIAGNMTTIGNALRSLQSQVDAVATKNCWDEIMATNAYFDMLSVGAHINASGDIVARGAVTAGATASSSDARLKDDIKTVSPSKAISILSQLKGREWVWNERREAFAGKRGSGLVAQEVLGVMPWAVLDLNGEYSITYGSFWGIAIPVIQSHESRIQSLESEVKRLRFENEQLKSKLTINS